MVPKVVGLGFEIISNIRQIFCNDSNKQTRRPIIKPEQPILFILNTDKVILILFSKYVSDLSI